MARFLQIVCPAATPFVEHVRMLNQLVGPEHERSVALLAAGAGLSVDLVEGIGESDSVLAVTRNNVAALASGYDVLYIHAGSYEPWMKALHHPKILACHAVSLPPSIDADAIVRVSMPEPRRFESSAASVEAVAPQWKQDELPEPDLALLLDRGQTVARVGPASRIDRPLFWSTLEKLLENIACNVAVFDPDPEDERCHAKLPKHLSRRVRLFVGQTPPWGRISLLLDVPLDRESALFMPVREAIAAGVPVIATDRGSDPAVQEAGELCARDAEALASACQKLLEDSAYTRRLQERAHLWSERVRQQWFAQHEPLIARFLPADLDLEPPRPSGWRSPRDLAAVLGLHVGGESDAPQHPKAGHWSLAAPSAPQQEALDLVSSLVRAARPEICLVQANEPLLPLTVAEAVRLNGMGRVILMMDPDGLPELDSALFRLELEELIEKVADLEEVPQDCAGLICLSSDRRGTFHDYRPWEARGAAGALLCAVQRRPEEYGIQSLREAFVRAGMDCLTLPMPRGLLVAQTPPVALSLHAFGLGEGATVAVSGNRAGGGTVMAAGRRLGALLSTLGTVEIEIEGPAGKRFDLFVRLDRTEHPTSAKVSVEDSRSGVIARFGRLTSNCPSQRRSVVIPEEGRCSLKVEAPMDVAVVWCLENARIVNEQAVEFLLGSSESEDP